MAKTLTDVINTVLALYSALLAVVVGPCFLVALAFKPEHLSAALGASNTVCFWAFWFWSIQFSLPAPIVESLRKRPLLPSSRS